MQLSSNQDSNGGGIDLQMSDSSAIAKDSLRISFNPDANFGNNEERDGEEITFNILEESKKSK